MHSRLKPAIGKSRLAIRHCRSARGRRGHPAAPNLPYVPRRPSLHAHEEPDQAVSGFFAMDKPSPGSLLRDHLLEMDEARNARPRVPQQASEMVKERDARLAQQVEKMATLRRAREAAAPNPLLPHIVDYVPRKRELIDTGTDKRYVRRNERGTSFVESDDVGRSLAADRRQHAKTKVKAGYGDKGDQPRRKIKAKARSKTAGRKGAARKSARKTRTKRRR